MMSGGMDHGMDHLQPINFDTGFMRDVEGSIMNDMPNILNNV
jgi:hypothetical protein